MNFCDMFSLLPHILKVLETYCYDLFFYLLTALWYRAFFQILSFLYTIFYTWTTIYYQEIAFRFPYSYWIATLNLNSFIFSFHLILNCHSFHFIAAISKAMIFKLTKAKNFLLMCFASFIFLVDFHSFCFNLKLCLAI